jgi:hypothetical protein
MAKKNAGTLSGTGILFSKKDRRLLRLASAFSGSGFFRSFLAFLGAALAVLAFSFRGFGRSGSFRRGGASGRSGVVREGRGGNGESETEDHSELVHGDSLSRLMGSPLLISNGRANV